MYVSCVTPIAYHFGAGAGGKEIYMQNHSDTIRVSKEQIDKVS